MILVNGFMCSICGEGTCHKHLGLSVKNCSHTCVCVSVNDRRLEAWKICKQVKKVKIDVRKSFSIRFCFCESDFVIRKFQGLELLRRFGNNREVFLTICRIIVKNFEGCRKVYYSTQSWTFWRSLYSYRENCFSKPIFEQMPCAHVVLVGKYQMQIKP